MNIFLATSFSSKVDPDGNVLADHRTNIETVIDALEGAGHEVFCAAKNEDWKITAKDPAEELLADIEQIKSSELIVTLLEEKLSAGVQIEIGYALAHHKRILLAHPFHEPLAWSNAAVARMKGCHEVTYNDFTDLSAQLTGLLKNGLPVL